MFQDIPNIRVAVFAHGDYEDKKDNYDTTWVDFTTDEDKLCSFVRDVSSTCGYDFEECYELVLRQVSKKRTSEIVLDCKYEKELNVKVCLGISPHLLSKARFEDTNLDAHAWSPFAGDVTRGPQFHCAYLCIHRLVYIHAYTDTSAYYVLAWIADWYRGYGVSVGVQI